MNLLKRLKRFFTRRGKSVDEIKEGIDFRFNENADVVIISGKYDGVIVKFNNISISEPETIDGHEIPPHLSFHYDIVSGVDFSDEELLDDLEFKNHIGNILTSIIINSETKAPMVNVDDEVDYIEI